MMSNKKVSSPNNIWNKEGFSMCGLGENLQTEAELDLLKEQFYALWD